MQPNGESESSYLTEIQNLYDSGYKLIVTPGYKFETAIYKAQSQYEDAKFVLIDGEPNDGKDNYLVADNTVAIYFAEEQSGFIAGVDRIEPDFSAPATALPTFKMKENTKLQEISNVMQAQMQQHQEELKSFYASIALKILNLQFPFSIL